MDIHGAAVFGDKLSTCTCALLYFFRDFIFSIQLFDSFKLYFEMQCVIAQLKFSYRLSSTCQVSPCNFLWILPGIEFVFVLTWKTKLSL